MSKRLVEMAKLFLFLVLVCFQLSSQEELVNTENDITNNETSTNDIEILDGEDETQWHYQKEEDLDDEWTGEDEKWLQAIEALLQDSDEDYDDDSEEFEMLINEIDKYFDNKHPKNSTENGFENSSEYDDDDSEEFENLINKIDEYLDKKYPKEGKEKNDDLIDFNMGVWRDIVVSYYPLYDKEKVNALIKDGKNDLDLYYSWLLQNKLNNENQKKPIAKRFSSV